MSHPQSTAVRWLVDQMRAAGVDWLLVCPGSRSTPLVQAAAELEEAGHWRMQVILDERQAGFAALGLARTGRRPAVLTTSGSAVAHLLPACVEAGETAAPLLLLTADRPRHLRDCGAPQTVRQVELLASYARVADLDLTAGLSASDRDLALAALGLWQRGDLVQLNACLDTPLALQGLPAGAAAEQTGAAAFAQLRADTWEEWEQSGASSVAARPQFGLEPPGPGERVIVVAGPLPVDLELAALLPDLCSRAVVLAEWTSQLAPLAAMAGAPRTYDALLRDPWLLEKLRPDRIVRLGEWPASKGLQTLLERANSLGVAVQAVWGPRRSDPLAQVTRASWLAPAQALAQWRGSAAPDVAAWRSVWAKADKAAMRAGDLSVGADWELAAVRALMASLAPETAMIVGNSMPVRDIDALNLHPRPCARVLCSRGANGIDGTLAMAWGAALGSAAPTRAYLGDSAVLHDIGSLQLLAERRAELDLRILAVDNDGGAIFDYLPARAAMAQSLHERCFTAPHGLDLVAIASSFGLNAVRVTTAEELAQAWNSPGTGVRVAVLTVNREYSLHKHREWQRQQVTAATAAIGPQAPC